MIEYYTKMGWIIYLQPSYNFCLDVFLQQICLIGTNDLGVGTILRNTFHDLDSSSSASILTISLQQYVRLNQQESM